MRKRKTRSNQNVASVTVKLKYHFPESQRMRNPNIKCIILISFPSFSQQPSKRRISVKQNLKKARVPVCVKSKSTESKTRARFFCAWPGSRAKNRRSNRISKSEVRSPLKYRNDEQQLRASKLNDVDLMDQRRSGFIINRWIRICE